MARERDTFKSVIAWLLILGVGYCIVAFGAAILAGFAYMMTTAVGAAAILILLVGGAVFGICNHKK